MRALSIAFVLACAAMTVSAHVGTDQDGSKYRDTNGEEYMMCGKCTYGGGGTDATKQWYKLVCDSAATNSSLWATLHYECNSGCGTCGATSAVSMGNELLAAYKSGLFYTTTSSYTYKYLMTPASVQCCPQIVQNDQYDNDNTCSGTPTSTTYSPAGCAWPSNLSISYGVNGCPSDGAVPEMVSFCTSSTYMKTGDSCPSTHDSCLYTISDVTQSPCLSATATFTYNGTTTSAAMNTNSTSTCRIDGTQQCLRLVQSGKYLANMTTGTDDISALSCLASNTGTSLAGGGSGASVVSFAAAVIAVIVITLV